MIYKPRTIKRMWDTWMFYHKGNYYLYYLAAEHGPGEGICLATSADGVHWKEIGLIFAKAKDAQWLGSGSVWKSPSFRADRKFIMNFSEWRGPATDRGQQTIFFTESIDLIHWTRLGPEYEFKPDSRWYNINQGNSSRWDCIYTIPRSGGGRYGYWTANPTLFQPGFGFGESLDGLHWTALTPALIEWGKVPKPASIEVGAVEKLAGRYYVMIGTRDYMGRRGMFQLVGSNPHGPFRPAAKNCRLLTSSGEDAMSYFTRFFPMPEGMLINHHSITRDNQSYFAPLKRAIVDKEGILRLGYWEGNEKLKGNVIKLKVPNRLRKADKKDMVMLDQIFDLNKGLVLEGTMNTLSTQRLGQDSEIVGFYIEESTKEGTAIMVHPSGITDFGRITVNKSDFRRDDRVDRQLEIDGKCTFRLLVRHTLLEFYLNGLLIQCYSLPVETTGKVGLMFNPRMTNFENLAAYPMTLG